MPSRVWVGPKRGCNIYVLLGFLVFMFTIKIQKDKTQGWVWGLLKTWGTIECNQ